MERGIHRRNPHTSAMLIEDQLPEKLCSVPTPGGQHVKPWPVSFLPNRGKSQDIINLSGKIP